MKNVVKYIKSIGGEAMKKVNKVLAAAGVLSIFLGTQSVSAASIQIGLPAYSTVKKQTNNKSDYNKKLQSISDSIFKKTDVKEDSKSTPTNNPSYTEPTSISGAFTLSRSTEKKSLKLGKVTITPTSTLALNMPNNSGKDIIQGDITLKSLSDNSSKTYKFINLYNEEWEFKITGLTPGVYSVTLNPQVCGKSNSATISYKIS